MRPWLSLRVRRLLKHDLRSSTEPKTMIGCGRACGTVCYDTRAICSSTCDGFVGYFGWVCCCWSCSTAFMEQRQRWNRIRCRVGRLSCIDFMVALWCSKSYRATDFERRIWTLVYEGPEMIPLKAFKPMNKFIVGIGFDHAFCSAFLTLLAFCRSTHKVASV